jgi:post-segregation antitoxin (ccd killing protein)
MQDCIVCIVRRMPRVQVYLPDDLYDEMKSEKIKASELLQHALRVELRRRQLIAAAEEHFADLEAEVGAPSAAEIAEAERILGLALPADAKAG